jgi:hypothetical protein
MYVCMARSRYAPVLATLSAGSLVEEAACGGDEPERPRQQQAGQPEEMWVQVTVQASRLTGWLQAELLERQPPVDGAVASV